MRQTVWQRLALNLSTLLLAFILAVVVWVSAVVTADPNVEQVYGPVTVELVGQAPDLLLVSDVPEQTLISLKVPQSIWDRLVNNPSLVKSWIDLTGLDAGEHSVQIQTQVNASPVRVLQVSPDEVNLTLETLKQVELPVQVNVTGNLPPGYRKGNPSVVPDQISVSGPESLVSKVVGLRVSMDVTGAVEPVKKTLAVEAIDQNGSFVSGVTLTPRQVVVTQPVSLLGGFKNVAVKVVTTGQVANGYRLTNILVSPPTVTLYSDDPRLMNEIPGFVETLPVDLDNLSDDVEISVGLNLPENITTIREPVVLVQVSVAAIEGTLTIEAPVVVTGLADDLKSTISPQTVDVIVSGPLNILDALTPEDFRVILDLSDLPAGVYQRSPVVEIAPAEVRVQTTLPETVEVTIEQLPTPTPTPTLVDTTPAASPNPETPVATPSPTAVLPIPSLTPKP